MRPGIQSGATGSGAGAPGARVTLWTPGPRPSPMPPPPPRPPTPLPAQPPPPTNRRQVSRSPQLAPGLQRLPAAKAGPRAGSREGDSPRARRTVPGRVGWAAAVSSVPAQRAAATARDASPPAATTAEERGPARAGGQALTCRRGNTGQLPDGTAQWGADREKGGRATRAVKQPSSEVLLSPAHPGVPLPRPPNTPVLCRRW